MKSVIEAIRNGDWFEVFRPDVYILDNGQPWPVSAAVLDNIDLNAKTPGREPRLVPGHPVTPEGIPDSEPALAIMETKVRSDTSLWARVRERLYPDAEFENMLNGYWTVSGGFIVLSHDLQDAEMRHIGLIGKEHPRVPGLRATETDTEAAGYLDIIIPEKTALERAANKIDNLVTTFVNSINPDNGGDTMFNFRKLSPDNAGGGAGTPTAPKETVTDPKPDSGDAPPVTTAADKGATPEPAPEVTPDPKPEADKVNAATMAENKALAAEVTRLTAKDRERDVELYQSLVATKALTPDARVKLVNSYTGALESGNTEAVAALFAATESLPASPLTDDPMHGGGPPANAMSAVVEKAKEAGKAAGRTVKA